MLKNNYFKWIFNLNSSRNAFHLITFLIFILAFINIFYKIKWTENGFEAAFNLWNPSWLLFGPLLFCAYKAFVGKPIRISYRHLFHLIPFLAFTCFFDVVYLYTDMHYPWQSELFKAYQNSYAVIIFSLLIYSVYVIRNVLRAHVPHKTSAENLIISIAAIFLLIALVIAMMYTAWGITHVDIGIDYRFFSYALLLFVNVTIVWYWVFGNDSLLRKRDIKQKTITKQVQSYRHSSLTEPLVNLYKSRILNYFNNHTVYLDTNLSLDSLAKDLDIPKHYLSQLFNVHFGKSFHSFVAGHRIDYAISLLNMNNGRLKIESLAYASGFNSKTSFNRYFKEITGYTPSEYQEQLEIKMAQIF